VDVQGGRATSTFPPHVGRRPTWGLGLEVGSALAVGRGPTFKFAPEPEVPRPLAGGNVHLLGY
jgi:hypothetical protein